MRALLGPALLAILPLAVWPDLERPFSDPKLIWLIASTVALLAVRPPARVSPAAWWTAAVWIAAFVLSGLASALPSASALALGICAPIFAVAVVRTGAAPSTLVAAQVVGATACAAVALAQWAGLDPFVAAGWHPPIDGASVRMRVYGTLGNPNFVGAVMAMSLPLTLATLAGATKTRARRLAWAALAAQAAALAATGSRGAVLGLGAAVAVYATLRWSRRVRLGLAAVGLFAGAAIALSPARPLDTTAAGRLHLWRIALPHAWESPLTGQGPGAVALRFSTWQREAAREGVRDRRFAGLADHVHNDYLEALIERGVPGFVSAIVPIMLLGAAAPRRPRPIPAVVTGSIAAVAAGAACALVDFPLARPTELAWWWVAIVVSLQFGPSSPWAAVAVAKAAERAS